MTPPLPDIPVAFVAQIDAHPGDPGPPAVLSDWLAERGWWAWENVLGWVLACPGAGWPRWLAARWFEASGDAARAEFVRVQCELAQIEAIEHDCDPDVPWAETTCPACGAFGAAEALAVRGRELIKAHWVDWLAGLLPDPIMGHPADSGPCVSPIGNVCVEFRRGFVEEVACAAADWLAHAITSAAPVRRVRLTTMPGVRYHPPKWDDGPWWQFDHRHRLHEGVPAGNSVNPPAVEQMLAAEFPGITFELPASSPVRGTAMTGGVTVPVTSWAVRPDATPLEDFRRVAGSVREVSGEFVGIWNPEAAPGEFVGIWNPEAAPVEPAAPPPPAPAWSPAETGRPRANSRRPDWYDNRRRRGRRRR